jgi:LPS-assembly protein
MMSFFCKRHHQFPLPTIWAILVLSLTFILLSPCDSFAQASSSARLKTASGSPVLVNAQSITRDTERQVIELSGHVQVIYDEQHLSCDRAVIHLDTQEVEAEGNLVISSAKTYVEGDRAQMNYNTNTGVIYNGFVQSGTVVFEGAVVRKTGPLDYEAEHGYFTACTTCPPAWAFRGSRIRAEVGGYAHISNAIFYIGDVPAFWMPYLVVPLKSERQSGLLSPTLESPPNAGTGIGLHYFWAISRSQDATFSFKNYQGSGQKGLVEYRYSLNPESSGQLHTGGLITDKVFVTDPAFEQGLPTEQKDNNFGRGFLTYHHFQNLPDGFTHYVNLGVIRDLYYPRDYPEDIPGWGEPSIENRMWLTHNTEATHASIDGSYYINFLKQDPLANNTDAVHRLPEIRYSIAQTELGKSGLLFHGDIDYVNFARQNYAYDDVITDKNIINAHPECLAQISHLPANATPKCVIDPSWAWASTVPGVGTFSPSNDVIRSGQRLDVVPELSYPFQIGKLFDVLPSVSFHHTQYSFDTTPDNSAQIDPSDTVSYDTHPTRDFVRERVSFRTRFSHVLGTDGGARETRYKHEIEPQIIATGLSGFRQSQSPFFSANDYTPLFLQDQPISDSDFFAQNVQFDYNDRITNRNVLTALLSNKLIRKRWEGDDANYRQIVYFGLAQSYDFDAASHYDDPNYKWSDTAALLDIRFDNFETNTLVRYFPFNKVANTSARAKIFDNRGDYLQTTITQQNLITQDPTEAVANKQEDLGLGGGLMMRYFSFNGAIDWAPVRWDAPLASPGFIMKSWSMFVNIKPPGNCWGLHLILGQTIGSKPTSTFSFDLQYGGDSSASPTPATAETASPPADSTKI